MKVVFIFLLFSWKSFALFHFEPGIGYNRGHYQTSKAQGLGLSLKLGADIKKMFVVIDIGYHDLQLGNTPTSNLQDSGLTIGGHIKSLRIWYTHLAGATLTTGTGDSVVKRTGAGLKLGLSGELASGLYLNLEARFIDLTKSEAAGVETEITQFLDAAFLSVSWEL